MHADGREALTTSAADEPKSDGLVGSLEDGTAGRAGRSSITARRWTVLISRIIAALAAATILAIAGWGYAVTVQADRAIEAREIDALVPDDPNIVSPSRDPSAGAHDAGDGPAGADIDRAVPEGQPTQTAGAAENILILGLDTRPPAEAAAVGGTSQSDVIMIAHLSGDRQRLDLLSIPRDLMITAPTCKAWDYATGSLSDRDFDNPYTQWKITNAYAVGGPQCTVRAVQALTGLEIHRLIVLDFDGFKAIVDAMGGLELTFSGPVIDDGVVIVERPGTLTVHGDQALALVRARKVVGDPTGDLGRIGRQQQVLTAMLSKVVSTGTLLDPDRLAATVKVVIENMATDNITLDDLSKLALSLEGSGPSASFYTLPTVPDSGSDGLAQLDSADSIFDALVHDQPFPVSPTGS